MAGILLSFLLILFQPSDLLQNLGCWWYLIHPKWSSELTIVSSYWLHFAPPIPLNSLLGTVSVTFNQCTFTFLCMSVYFGSFDVWYSQCPFALWEWFLWFHVNVISILIAPFLLKYKMTVISLLMQLTCYVCCFSI